MPEETPDICRDIVLKLNSRKASVRQEAERDLAALGPAAVDRLLALMEKEGVNRRKRRNIGIAVVIVYIFLVVLSAVTNHGASAGSYSGMFGAIAALFAATQLQKNAAGALARYDDVRGVGFLAEAMEYGDKGIERQAETALVRLLPRLRATDHALLTEPQRRCLDRALVKRRSPELALAILAAYEQVGDEKSVELVERIASAQIPAIKDHRVIKRAAEVLPALRHRAELVRAAQTLLRPADKADADILLRPASGPPTGPVETLLRPVEDERDISGLHETPSVDETQRLDHSA